MCGSATHPGGGIMGAPGRNAATQDPGRLHDHRRHRRRTQWAGGGVLSGEGRARTDRLSSEPRRFGGGAVTGELHPGFRCPTLNHHVALRSDIIADMQLARHGVEFLKSPVEVFAPALDGPAAVIYGDDQRTTQALRAVHATDADPIRDVSRVTRRCRAGCCAHCSQRLPQASTNRTFGISGTFCRLVGSFGHSVRATRTGCFGGRRCQSPISRANGSNRTCCARP